MNSPHAHSEFVRHLRTFREELILMTLAILILLIQIWLMMVEARP